MKKVKIKKNIYNKLFEYLWENDVCENGCFLLIETINDITFITDIILPKNDSYLVRDIERCEPSTEYISNAILFANKYNSSLAFIHTHPNEKHPRGFSMIDDISNDKLFNSLYDILNKPIGSFVSSKNGIHGTIFDNGKYKNIDEYHIIGNRFKKLNDSVYQSKFKDETTEEFDRQLLFTGNDSHKLIKNLNISVIGCGGSGSPLAIQLAKIGVGKINLFDGDKVEITNVPRIYGASKKDVGRYKVDVLKEEIEKYTSTNVFTYNYFINEENDILVNSDIIFGCIDNHSARDIINHVAYKYAIPYIDVSCAIPLSDDGTVMQVAVQVQSVMPESSCLWCSGILNANRIREESLSVEEKRELIEDGYYNEIEKQPSIISLTTNAATLAITRFLHIIDVFKGNYSPRIIYEYSDEVITRPSCIKNEKCRCSTMSLLKQRLI